MASGGQDGSGGGRATVKINLVGGGNVIRKVSRNPTQYQHIILTTAVNTPAPAATPQPQGVQVPVSFVQTAPQACNVTTGSSLPQRNPIMLIPQTPPANWHHRKLPPFLPGTFVNKYGLTQVENSEWIVHSAGYGIAGIPNFAYGVVKISDLRRMSQKPSQSQIVIVKQEMQGQHAAATSYPNPMYKANQVQPAPMTQSTPSSSTAGRVDFHNVAAVDKAQLIAATRRIIARKAQLAAAASTQPQVAQVPNVQTVPAPSSMHLGGQFTPMAPIMMYPQNPEWEQPQPKLYHPETFVNAYEHTQAIEQSSTIYAQNEAAAPAIPTPPPPCPFDEFTEALMGSVKNGVASFPLLASSLNKLPESGFIPEPPPSLGDLDLECVEDASANSAIPGVLRRELNMIDNNRFKVEITQQDSAGIMLKASLIDNRLPIVPPLIFFIPNKYPDEKLRLINLSKDYGNNAFFSAVAESLNSKMSLLSAQITMMGVLHSWEMCVRQVSSSDYKSASSREAKKACGSGGGGFEAMTYLF